MLGILQMKKILLLVSLSLLGTVLSAQATQSVQCPPANAITFSWSKQKWVLDNAYASQWSIDWNVPGETDKEQVDPLAVLHTDYPNNHQVVCQYIKPIDNQGHESRIMLWGIGTFSFNPASNPHFVLAADRTTYACITSAAHPEVCPVIG